MTLRPNFITLHLIFTYLLVYRLPLSTFNVMARKTQLERAIEEIQGRRPAPDIDFTQHQLENGFTVSTQERVVKEVILPLDPCLTSLLMEYPCPARVAVMCLQVQAPAMNIPTDEQFFSKTEKGKPDIAYLKNHFYREGRVKEEHALYVIEKATEILHTEPNLLHVDAPVTGVLSQPLLRLPSLALSMRYLSGLIDSFYYSLW